MLAGASGDLGGRIARTLATQGAQVRALVRTSIPALKRDVLEKTGVELVAVDLHDRDDVVSACHGALCVVSTLNGLRDVVIDAQRRLLEAAVAFGFCGGLHPDNAGP
ncbi:NmrA family NAD(P)-binding protein [Novosphingobium sp. Gsoil 351]|uniref:NmrA family NAD(P)-binding protein n=1 Tax=Novosphingobium sp. Gsoil 351 TaxID=2675225 RepID=UPI001E33A5E3|nr:NmrA family NAD(P)-binding protein [Novosphingobium sp. Gsoil 351]